MQKFCPVLFGFVILELTMLLPRMTKRRREQLSEALQKTGGFWSESRYKKRLVAILLAADFQHPPMNTKNTNQYSSRTITRLIRRYVESGYNPESLKDMSRSGRTRLWSSKSLVVLAKCLRKRNLTASDMLLILKESGFVFSIDTVRREIRRQGYKWNIDSYQKF